MISSLNLFSLEIKLLRFKVDLSRLKVNQFNLKVTLLRLKYDNSGIKFFLGIILFCKITLPKLKMLLLKTLYE